MTPFDDNKDMSDVRDEAAVAGRPATPDDAALVDFLSQLRANTAPPTPNAALQALFASGLPTSGARPAGTANRLDADGTPTEILGRDGVPTQVLDLGDSPTEVFDRESMAPDLENPTKILRMPSQNPAPSNVVPLRPGRRHLRRFLWATGTGVGVTAALLGGVAAAAISDGVPLSRIPEEVSDRIHSAVDAFLDSTGLGSDKPSSSPTPHSADPSPLPAPTQAPTGIPVPMPTDIPIPVPTDIPFPMPTDIPMPDFPIPTEIPIPEIPDPPPLPEPPPIPIPVPPIDWPSL